MSSTYHHGDLKSALMRYARLQLENASWEQLSLREMAKAMAVSHAAPYRHFSDKRALLEAVVIAGFEELTGQCRAAADEWECHAHRARLKACGLAYVRFGLHNPRLLNAMFTTLAEPQSGAPLVDTAAVLFDVLMQTVSAGQAAGLLRTGDARAHAHACWAMVHGLSALLAVGMMKATEAQLHERLQSAEASIEVFLDGMAPEASHQTTTR